MVGITISAVFLTLLCHGSCQFYDPGLFLRGFAVPFRSFLQHFPIQDECTDPCKSTSCPAGSICRIVQVQCFRAPCTPLPICIEEKFDDAMTNPCLINRPLMSTSRKELVSCLDGRSTTCPTGSKCTLMSFDQGSRCCYAPQGCAHARPLSSQYTVGHVPLVSDPHPAAFSNNFRNVIRPPRHGIKPRPIATSLRRTIVTRKDKEDTAVPFETGSYKTRDLPSNGKHRTNPGTCRSSLHYRTCRNQCTDDSQCGVGKCCPTRCGTKICTYDRTGRYLG